MPKPKGGLGRGLGSLIPQGQTPQEDAYRGESAPPTEPPVSGAASRLPEAAASPGMLDVPVASIAPNPRQPRQEIAEPELDELAASIREHGLLQPLLVTRSDEGQYYLIAGERRWRASMLAGLQRVPVVVREASSRQMLELALVENLQRADLNPLEEAAAYRSLVDEFDLKQDEVAARIGKSRQAVTNSLRLLKLPHAVQESLARGLITEGHARALLQAPTERAQLRLMERTVAEGLSVRQVEALARRLAADAGANEGEEVDGTRHQQEGSDTGLYDEVRDLEGRFRNALGTKVQLSRSSRGGKLVIYFYSNEELDRIYGTIVGEE